jgi:drug/metabolite transporter (DMT)-like permease
MFSDKRFLGFLLAFIATGFWASFYIVSRYAFGENENRIDPVFFSFLRYLMASILFTIILTWQKNLGKAVHILKGNLGIFIFLALTGVVLEGTLIFWSLKYTTAARSSLFANACPIFTMIMAVFALGEIITWRKLLGMTIGFAGAAVAIMTRGNGDIYFSATSVIGDLLALASGICWAAYTVWGTGVSGKYGSLLSTAITVIIGTIILAGIVVLGGGPMVWSYSWPLWAAILYLGVFANGLSYVCWYAALKYLKAGELGAFGYISAALTAMLSFFLLKESFSIYFFIAMTAIIAGVYLMLKQTPESEIPLAIPEAGKLQERSAPTFMLPVPPDERIQKFREMVRELPMPRKSRIKLQALLE